MLCYFALKNSIRIPRPKYHVTRAADVILVPEDEFSMAESKQARDNEADIALLVLPISKVVKTDRSRRASACISSPKIQL